MRIVAVKDAHDCRNFWINIFGLIFVFSQDNHDVESDQHPDVQLRLLLKVCKISKYLSITHFGAGVMQLNKLKYY